jgi:hypothetical protein
MQWRNAIHIVEPDKNPIQRLDAVTGTRDRRQRNNHHYYELLSCRSGHTQTPVQGIMRDSRFHCM